MNLIRIRRALSLWVALLALSSCASSHGLSRDVLQEEIRQEESRFIGISPAAATPQELHISQLGMYLKPTGFIRREFEWTSRDRDALLAWSKQIPLGAKERSPVFLTVSSLKGDTLAEARASATRYGVDRVLVFDGAAAVDRYNNYKAALLYWTILGAYLADGTHSDALCLLKATLWDVKTGARLFEEEVEARTRSVGPAALVDDMQEISRAKTMAMNILLERLKDRFSMPAGTGR